jgi:hypothetical protein
VVSWCPCRVPAKKRYLLVDSSRLHRVPVTNRGLSVRRVCSGDVALNRIEDRRELYLMDYELLLLYREFCYLS